MMPRDDKEENDKKEKSHDDKNPNHVMPVPAMSEMSTAQQPGMQG